MFWIFEKVLPKMSKKIYASFEKYFEKYYRISKIIAENLENNFMKFCELYRKFSKIISKKFRIFRQILQLDSPQPECHQFSAQIVIQDFEGKCS